MKSSYQYLYMIKFNAIYYIYIVYIHKQHKYTIRQGQRLFSESWNLAFLTFFGNENVIFYWKHTKTGKIYKKKFIATHIFWLIWRAKYGYLGSKFWKNSKFVINNHKNHKSQKRHLRLRIFTEKRCVSFEILWYKIFMQKSRKFLERFREKVVTTNCKL